MDCMHKSKGGDSERGFAKVDSALIDIGYRVEHHGKSLEVLGRTCLETQKVAELIAEHQRTLDQQQQLAFARIEQQQHMVLSNLQQMMVTTLRSFFESKDGARASLTDFDSVLTSRLQPLGCILEDMQKQFGKREGGGTPRTPHPPVHSDALFKRLEEGYSNVQVQREVMTYVSSSGHKIGEAASEDLGQEGLSVPPGGFRRRPLGATQGNDGFREELQTLHRSELQMFQKSLLADLKKDQMEPILGEFKKQELILLPLSTKMEVLMNSQNGLPAVAPARKSPDDVVDVLQSISGDTLGRQKNGLLRNSADVQSLPQKIGSSRASDVPGLLLEDSTQSTAQNEDELHQIELKEDTSLMSVFMYDDDVEAPPYNVEDYFSKTGWAQELARSHNFQQLTILVVCMNALWIGIDSDWNTEANIYDSAFIYQFFAQFFVVYFSFEWFIRLLAFEKKRDCWRDGWFRFDTFLVATMVLDVWVLMPFLKIVFGKGAVKVPTQPLRIIRLLKLTRMARLMRAFPELVTMVKGLFRALRAIASSLILIALMVYIWAILLHMLMKDNEDINNDLNKEFDVDFRTLPRAMWVLVIDGTLLLDGASAVMTHLMFSKEFGPLIAGIAFTSYTLLSALLVLQMLIGVLCDVVSRVQEEQRNATDIGLVKQELLHKLREVDNGDGRISQPELMRVLGESKSKTVLKKLNINRLFLLQLQTMMFRGNASGSIPIKAALDLMLLCRSTNKATVETLAGGFCYMSNQLQDMRARMLNEAGVQSIGGGEHSQITV